MLAGHFGLAAIVKSRQPQLPLWALMLSTQLLDVVFVVLVALGLESFTGGGYGELTLRAYYSHSAVGVLAISILAASAAGLAWGRSNGIIIGLMVASHWVLDLLVHRMDMPFLPGNGCGAGAPLCLGLGLWAIPWLSIAMEMALVLVGAFLYYHASMRSAVRAERQDSKSGEPPKGYRRQAIIASVAMLVFLLGTLIGNALGY